MELGEIDLAHLLARQKGKPININSIRLYWEQVMDAFYKIRPSFFSDAHMALR